MRINSQSSLTDTDVREAIAQAVFTHGQDIHLEELTTGTRGAITFYCFAQNGKYSTGRNDSHGLKAASWTAYGWVIAELFTRDPEAHIGRYRGRDHFIRSIYAEQRRWIIRQSLGVRSHDHVGEDCGFLSLFDDNILNERYSEVTSNPDYR